MQGDDVRLICLWMLVSVGGLAACSAEPDLSAVVAAKALAVQRHDLTQALASNGKVVVAGTQSGVVLTSADQGATWKRAPTPGASMVDVTTCADGSFLGIDFYSRVWAAPADGQQWKSVPLKRPHTPLAVACDPSGAWWVTGTGSVIAVSRDQGQNWTVTDQGEDVQYTTVQFVDKDYGVVTGEFGNVLVTEDGGATWTKRPPVPSEFYPYAALFANRNDGWMSGLAGQVMRTNDGGRTWQVQTNATNASLYRLFMHQGVPHGVGAVGTVARLDGDVWRAVGYPDAVPAPLSAGVTLAGSNALLIGGPSGLLRQVTSVAN